MTKVSRFKIDPKHLGFFINNFWAIITLLENKEQVKSFLKDLLTHTEMKMLAKRIQIAKMLLEGYDYRSIKNYVRVTDQTIARISNLLEEGTGGLKTAVVFIQELEKKIDRQKMGALDLKKKYPMYFLPEIIFDEVGKKIRAGRKKTSAKQLV